MMFIGDDWAEDHHDIEMESEGGHQVARTRLPEGLSPTQPSYSATIRGLYSTVKVHRRGLSGSSGASSPMASSRTRCISKVGMVISVYLIRLAREGWELQQMSQVMLTERATRAPGVGASLCGD